MVSQPYKIPKYLLVITAAWCIIVPGAWNPFSHGGNVLRAQIPRITTKFQVDPFWPKPLPNDWVMGNVGGVCVDPQDHVFILERTADLIGTNAAQAVEYGPPVFEYAPDGTFLNAWGDPRDSPDRDSQLLF